MDTLSLFAANLVTSVLANFTVDAVKKLLSKVVELKPSLEGNIASAQTSQDIERIFQEAVGVIDAIAGDGLIDVDGALLTAMRGARFDHAHGKVTISNSTVEAPILVTGGQSRATGKTTVGGNTNLKSQGTEIKVGKGASIVITGSASIKQS